MPLGFSTGQAGGLRTVTSALPCVDRRESGTTNWIWLVEMLVKLVREVCVPLAFQFTSDCVDIGGFVPVQVPGAGRKSCPARVTEMFVLPAPMALGVMEFSVGSLLGGGLMMKLMVLDRPLSELPE